jgi:hypothetical protein
VVVVVDVESNFLNTLNGTKGKSNLPFFIGYIIFIFMTNEQKAQQYGELLNEHTRLGNRINSIKGESIDLNQGQLNEIKQLETQQLRIMNFINRLLAQ